MIPVLKENTQNASLGYFVNGVLPLAVFCQRKSNELTKMNDGIKAHSYELFYNQLWNLLPSFCNCPIDIKTSFKVSKETYHRFCVSFSSISKSFFSCILPVLILIYLSEHC